LNQNMREIEYVLLGMRINRIDLSQQLYVYEIPQKFIAQARNYLIRDNIPHVVKSSKETSSLEIYVASRSKSLEENLGLKSILGGSVIPECELASSAIRLKLLNNGWRRARNKLYNPKLVEFNGEEYNLPIIIYSALRTTVDKLYDGKRILFIDLAKKVEFTESLEDIEQKYYNETILNKIEWVKIKESTTSFDIVKNIPSSIREIIEEKINDRIFKEKLSKVLTEYSGSEVKIDYNKEYVITTPRSSVLAGLIKEGVGVPITDDGRPIIPLPKDILTPVPSIENIFLFIDSTGNRDTLLRKISFLILPEDRVRKTNEIFKNIDLHVLEFNGLRIEVDTNSIIVNNIDNNVIEFDISTYFSMKKKDVKQQSIIWKPDFSKYREDIIVLPIVLNLQQNHDYNSVVREALNKLETLSREYGLKYLSELKCEPNIQDILNRLQGILQAYGSKNICAILFFHRSVDPEGSFIAQYRYYVAKLKIHSYVVDLTKEDPKKESIIEYKIKSVLKKFAVKMSAISCKLNPPQIIKNHVIAGIDSTTYQTEKGMLYPAVIIFILSPSGETAVETYLGGIGLSDIDALAMGIKSAYEHYGNRGLLAIINRSNITGVLQKLRNEIKDFRNKFSNGDLIITGVSKTHSYSRILIKKRDRIYNPRKPGVLVKLTSFNLDLDEETIPISRYLSITTTYLEEKIERGTIRPVIINIASQLKERDHLDIAEYLVSLSHFARISSLWAPSLPQPLHVANNYCRRLNSILRSLGQLGIRADITEIIKYI